MERTYRHLMQPADLYHFRVTVGQTDLWVAAESDLTALVKERAAFYRRQIKAYMQIEPDFADSLIPLPARPEASPIVRRMLAAGEIAGVGPMAAVAGAIAQAIGEDLAGASLELLIENGGDVFLRSRIPRVLAVLAGKSQLSGRLAVRLDPHPAGVGVCTSAGTVGPSLSFGRADAAMAIASDVALADAVATALGNRIKSAADLEPAVYWAVALPGITGALGILGGRLAAAGDLELSPLDGEES